MRFIAYFIVVLVCLYVGFQYFRIQGLIATSKVLIRKAFPYQNEVGFTPILVLGDSTAVGVGASSLDDTVPALLGREMQSSVENRAVSGAVTTDMEGQLRAAAREQYDLILIMVGGNDVVGVGSLSIVNQEMTTFLQDVRPYSNRIVLMPAGRVGDAPFFPAVAAPFINSRAAALRNYFMATAAAAGVQYVDLAGPVSDTFATDPAKYYAADMFHPSSAGYALWFAALKQTLSLQ